MKTFEDIYQEEIIKYRTVVKYSMLDVARNTAKRFLEQRLEDLGKPEYGPYSCDRCDIAQITLKDLIESLMVADKQTEK